MVMNIAGKIAVISAKGITCIKNAENPYFNSKYADLGVVVKALKEPLDEVGLVYKFVTLHDETGWILRMNVYDITGSEVQESESYEFPLNPVDPQKTGASITYAKRYLLCTAFNVIAEEDDDGNDASDNKPTLPKKKPTPMKQVNKIDGINDEVPNFFDE